MTRLLAGFLLFVCSVAQAFALNVFMAGDSHVCSKIYPKGVGRILREKNPDVDFSFYGKIGAGFYTYNESPAAMEEIFKAAPDVLIVHLGTNDSFTPRFDKAKFKSDLSAFYKAVKGRLPECRVVFVTPFFNKLKARKKAVNRSTRLCADAMLEFARDKEGVYVVDHNAAHGMHFLKNVGRLMRRDCVHLTEQGYEVLASQVGAAIAGIEGIWN